MYKSMLFLLGTTVTLFFFLTFLPDTEDSSNTTLKKRKQTTRKTTRPITPLSSSHSPPLTPREEESLVTPLKYDNQVEDDGTTHYEQQQKNTGTPKYDESFQQQQQHSPLFASPNTTTTTTNSPLSSSDWVDFVLQNDSFNFSVMPLPITLEEAIQLIDQLKVLSSNQLELYKTQQICTQAERQGRQNAEKSLERETHTNNLAEKRITNLTEHVLELQEKNRSLSKKFKDVNSQIKIEVDLLMEHFQESVLIQNSNNFLKPETPQEITVKVNADLIQSFENILNTLRESNQRILSEE